MVEPPRIAVECPVGERLPYIVLKTKRIGQIPHESAPKRGLKQRYGGDGRDELHSIEKFRRRRSISKEGAADPAGCRRVTRR
ncbi:hypothetical protein [Lichenicoccus roseus]|uniref:hypothetical protein n=1 Tax=Lichenicoccus roseus TaxID=2683649 RepID=UPI001F0F365A|nr:hypothetical protein [Lichenicoccus roseus]